MSNPTLAHRKRQEAARLAAAVHDLAADLAAYARRHGGRFILFGSAARGEMRHDSDVDLLADFPQDTWDAVDHAARRAAALGLKPDVRPWRFAGPALRERVAAEGRVLA